MVSEDRCERGRFVVELGKVCKVLEVSTYAEFEEALKGIVWLEAKSAARCSSFLSVLWGEVQLLGVGEVSDISVDGIFDVTAGF
jgi:hypothetical protein